MNLGLCIANLLRSYSAVGVPGIGVFRIVRIAAPYDTEQATVFPPMSRVELTDVQTDFFPIVDYLRAQRELDETTALQMIERVVEEVMATVAREGRALLDGVGYLVADGTSFVFKPFDTRTLDVSPITIPPISVDEAEETMAAATAVENEDTAFSRRTYTGWWIAAAAVLLSAATFLAYKAGWFDAEKERQFTENSEGPSGVTSPVDSIADSVSVTQLQANAVDSVHVDAAVVASKQPKPAITYEIIVGSFATMRQAQKYVAEMKAKGYDLQALDSRMPGNRKKISWGSYATEEEAYRELIRVQKNFEPGAWIAKIEND